MYNVVVRMAIYSDDASTDVVVKMAKYSADHDTPSGEDDHTLYIQMINLAVKMTLYSADISSGEDDYTFRWQILW